MISRILETPVLGFSIIAWLALSVCLSLLLSWFVRRDKLLVQLPGPPRGHWITGHFKKFIGPNGIQFQEDLAMKYGTTVRVNGAFGEEAIWTLDPAAMHSVLVKDRANFERPLGATLMIRSVFGGGLLGLTGEEHRVHRKLLNPVFTMKFLRELMPMFMDIAEQTCDGIKKDLSSAKSSSKEVDIFPWMTAAALELVGEAGLGHSFSSFTGQRNDYNVAIKSVMRVFSKLSPYIKILPSAYSIGTPAFRRWALQYIPIRVLQQLRHAVAIQNEQAEEVLRARQTLISSGGDLSSEAGRGRDIMTLLMKANEAEGSENHIDRPAMVGHMNVFVFAGHETTSTAVSRILNVLADRPQIQVRLREEIRLYFEEHEGDVNHDALLELPYLDAVVRETLRLYGPVTQLARVNQEDAIIPLEYPVQTPNGKVSSIPIKKGTRIIMNIAMANRYPKIWGERAHKYWPERWIGSKLDEVTQPGGRLPGVYSSMMTFGAGPTACIGFKFALLEIKVMIAALLKKFKFEPSQQEPIQWEALGIQFPYVKSEQADPDKVPKLPLRVIEL